MKNTNNPVICYQCKHRRDLTGDCHSRCAHPKAQAHDDPLSNIMAMFASVGRTEPQIGVAALELNIEANEHGIRNNWFNWPWNFDPIWLKNCDGFEEKK